ncbi:hypothetical protein F4809DRAFT_638370 [Biscogniauxia mediterranea]|nr:hypothetical protein F4809DRAFT_638370 [Biscogniauxia mediterranea]
MAGFFIADALRDAGLEFERIWEHDCDGVECAWVEDRDIESSIKMFVFLRCATQNNNVLLVI